MLRVLTYPLAVERHDEDGGYLAYFPSLPGCQTWGETYEAAVHNAENALAVYIETLTANGDPIPEPNINPKGRSLSASWCAPISRPEGECLPERQTFPPKISFRALEKGGFVFQRQKGSHATFRHPETKRTTVVPLL